MGLSRAINGCKIKRAYKMVSAGDQKKKKKLTLECLPSRWTRTGRKVPLEVYPLRNQMARSHSASAPPAGILAVLRARSSKSVKARCCVCRMLGTTYPGPHLRIVDNLYLMQILKLSINPDLLVHLKSFRGLSLLVGTDP